jgi:2-polyprenyl-3-methyl-5-hydroxy-6-metoxy-1,4-benzoquinol methylase
MQGIPYSVYKLYAQSRASVKIYAKLRWVLSHFKEIEALIPKKADVVDVGCGFGLLANYIAIMSQNRRVFGIDISTRRIQVAKRTVGTRQNIDFVRGDVKDLCLSECDVVVMTDFLHHISFDDQLHLLREVNSKLKIGGQLIVRDISAGRSWKYFCHLLLDTFLNIGKPLFFRNRRSWDLLLEQTGFIVTQVYSIDNFCFPVIIFVCEKTQTKPCF